VPENPLDYGDTIRIPPCFACHISHGYQLLGDLQKRLPGHHGRYVVDRYAVGRGLDRDRPTVGYCLYTHAHDKERRTCT